MLYCPYLIRIHDGAAQEEDVARGGHDEVSDDHPDENAGRPELLALAIRVSSPQMKKNLPFQASKLRAAE